MDTTQDSPQVLSDILPDISLLDDGNILQSTLSVTNEVLDVVANPDPPPTPPPPRHLVGGLPSPLKLPAWEIELEGDVDHDFLLEGVKYGFKIVDNDNEISSYECHNYGSALESASKSKMDALIKHEVSDGLLQPVVVKPKCVHAIGCVPKENGGIRPITDCSKPDKCAINNYMTLEKFKFKSVDDAAKLMSQDCWFAVIDLSKAYRTVPIHEDHWALQGLKWGDQYYVDTRLCFGLRCAPSIFNRMSSFIVRCMARHGYDFIVHYLDDFCIVHKNPNMVREAQQALISLLHTLGFSISWPKVISPTQVVKFLGIILDSTCLELRLPDGKLEALIALLKDFLKMKQASKRQLQSLCGTLAHCATVVKGGRTFSRRVIDLTNSLRQWHHKTRLNEDFKKDICWWLSFVKVFNGKAKVLRPDIVQAPLLQCDSSMSGFGIYYDGDWRAGVWHQDTTVYPPVVKNLPQWVTPSGVPQEVLRNINILELYPILVATQQWGASWQDKRVIIYTDNTQVQAMINTGRSCNKVAMAWLREIFWSSAIYNFHVTARRITSKDNVISDRLSRLSHPESYQSLVAYVTQQKLPLVFFN